MNRTIFQPPQLRQEKLESEHGATWLELFFDLIFVVAIAELAHNLQNDFSLTGLSKFVVLFIPVWWCWVGATFYDTQFNNDGLTDRLITLLKMIVVAIMATNLHHGLDASAIEFTLSYAIFRGILICQYLHAGYHVPEVKTLTNWFALGFGSSITFWLISVFVPAPWRFLLWGIGLVIDSITPLTVGKKIAQIPPNLSHITERIGLFTIIILGESIVVLVSGISSTQWSLDSILIALLGLSIIFSFWWMYFDTVDDSPLCSIKQGKMSTALTWLYSHLLLTIGLTATGVGIEKMIHSLDNNYIIIEKYLFCFSVALCLFILANIHWTSCNFGVTKYKKKLTFYRLSASGFVVTLTMAVNSLSSLIIVILVTIACIMQIVFDILNFCPRSEY